MACMGLRAGGAHLRLRRRQRRVLLLDRGRLAQGLVVSRLGQAMGGGRGGHGSRHGGARRRLVDARHGLRASRGTS